MHYHNIGACIDLSVRPFLNSAGLGSTRARLGAFWLANFK